MADEALANCINNLSAVFIFGGDIKRAEDAKHLGGIGWRSLKGLEADKTGPMPSYERVLAGAALHRMKPSLFLIASAGRTNLEGATDPPLISKVMAAELRELGVSAALIIEEQKSFVTQDHFLNCSAIARERSWKANEVGIVSLFWHFGRIAAMMISMQAEKQSIDPFALGVTPLISVERVLASEDDAKWNSYFKELYAGSDMTRTLAGEAIGTGQLLAGHAPQFGARYKGFVDPLAPC
jgi:DUF218 domain